MCVRKLCPKWRYFVRISGDSRNFRSRCTDASPGRAAADRSRSVRGAPPEGTIRGRARLPQAGRPRCRPRHRGTGNGITALGELEESPVTLLSPETASGKSGPPGSAAILKAASPAANAARVMHACGRAPEAGKGDGSMPFKLEAPLHCRPVRDAPVAARRPGVAFSRVSVPSAGFGNRPASLHCRTPRNRGRSLRNSFSGRTRARRRASSATQVTPPGKYTAPAGRIVATMPARTGGETRNAASLRLRTNRHGNAP